MATQLVPIDLNERSPKRQRTEGQTGKRSGIGGFGDDDEFASIMAGELSLDGVSGGYQKQRPDGGLYGSGGADQDEDANIRIEDLAVANERGEAVGAYVAPEQLSVEEAYRNYVTSKQRPVQDFDVEIRNLLGPMMRELGLTESGRPQKDHTSESSEGERSSSEDDDDDDEDGKDPVQRAIRRLGRKPDRRALGQSRGRKRKRGHGADPQAIQRREIDLLCTYGSLADREYILSRFESEIKSANMDETTLFTRLCPLCGFMDNTQDAVGNQEFQMIDRFADEGVGNMDVNTHATLLAFLWNKRIYLPMRRRNLRVLPLTARMARDHVTEPHRFNKRAELLNDIQDLRKTHRLLMATAFRKNGMTGELKFDKERLLVAVKVMDQKWKLIGTRDDKDPFKTAHRVTAASSGTQTNPLQSVRRRAHNNH